ncbi:6826_t:CDS:2 [Dentiscutata heterogama]|uniref:6826_t:CDS:1 n=1 Tax=Dentiscutata heterogama TaxID=1316150 RepID=A0ACA9K4X2_9GLOM|nr:6826_t:CDS:2 [Dentiscutata heterogama]
MDVSLNLSKVLSMSENFEKHCCMFMQDEHSQNELETNSFLFSRNEKPKNLKSQKYRRSKRSLSRSPPRPPNAFILYRKHIGSLLKEETDFKFHKFHTSNVSKIAAQKWNSESEEIKLKFERLANAAKIEHQRKYPGYKYKPKKKKSRRRNSCRLTDESITNNILLDLNKLSPLPKYRLPLPDLPSPLTPQPDLNDSPSPVTVNYTIKNNQSKSTNESITNILWEPVSQLSDLQRLPMPDFSKSQLQLPPQPNLNAFNIYEDQLTLHFDPIILNSYNSFGFDQF